VETHILDETIDAIQGAVEIFFVEFLRDNQKFSSLTELKQQIEKDIKEARKYLKTCKLYFNDFL
jgi:riboflavin kinase/FMN adenylyltransferase